MLKEHKRGRPASASQALQKLLDSLSSGEVVAANEVILCIVRAHTLSHAVTERRAVGRRSEGRGQDGLIICAVYIFENENMS